MLLSYGSRCTREQQQPEIRNTHKCVTSWHVAFRNTLTFVAIGVRKGSTYSHPPAWRMGIGLGSIDSITTKVATFPVKQSDSGVGYPTLECSPVKSLLDLDFFSDHCFSSIGALSVFLSYTQRSVTEQSRNGDQLATSSNELLMSPSATGAQPPLEPGNLHPLRIGQKTIHTSRTLNAFLPLYLWLKSS